MRPLIDPSTHPALQRERLQALLDAMGIAGVLPTYYSPRNANQLTLIDGELRSAVYRDTEWPCVVLDVSAVYVHRHWRHGWLSPCGGDAVSHPVLSVGDDAQCRDLSAACPTSRRGRDRAGRTSLHVAQRYTVR